MASYSVGPDPKQFNVPACDDQRILDQIVNLTRGVKDAVTQKARGMLVLRDAFPFDTPTTYLATNEEEVVAAYKLTLALGDEAFGRPCPFLPRPGFYDSVVLRDEEHAREMFIETKKIDPQGEVLVLPWVDPVVSATWTPGLMGVGPGNDGATAGKDAIGIPVAPYSPTPLATGTNNQVWQDIIAKAGVMKHPDVLQRFPHLETVYKADGKTVYVQVRAGQAAQGAGDYVPRPTTVVTVVKGPDDFTDPMAMIEWEKTSAKLGESPDGVMVWCPGGHQGTHTALHCKNNQLACVFQDEEPQVGDVFQSTDKPLPIDVDEVLRFAAAGLTFPITKEGYETPVEESITTRQALRCLLVLSHGYRPSGKEARWMGMAVGLLLRLGGAALLGERRHAGGRTRSRNQIHSRALKDWFGARTRITEAAQKFANHPWGGGFGGKPWLECTLATAEMDACLVTLARKRDEASVKALFAALNNTLNKAHNNGWWMNKFGDKSDMDYAAIGNPTIALDIAPKLYQMSVFANRERVACKAVVNRLQKSRRLRCLSDGVATTKPVVRKINPSSIQLKMYPGYIHTQYKFKSAGGYAVTNFMFDALSEGKQEKMSAADIEDYTQVDSLAGSGTQYCKVQGYDNVTLGPDGKDQKSIYFYFAGVRFVITEELVNSKNGGGIQSASLSVSVPQASKPTKPKYNEEDLYDISCGCKACKAYTAKQAEKGNTPEVGTTTGTMKKHTACYKTACCGVCCCVGDEPPCTGCGLIVVEKNKEES